MAKPQRLPSASPNQCYVVTSSTYQKRRLFQSETLSNSFVACLFEYRDKRKYLLHAYVVMPDHFHLLITPGEEMTLERCMQFIKGGFSHRAKFEMGRQFEIWQRGFTDRRIRDRSEYVAYTKYIHLNPVRARLVALESEYMLSSANPLYPLDVAPTYLSG
jgi:REP-associated tyrosine transposase